MNEKYNYWIEKLSSEDALYLELLQIKDNAKEIKDRFYQDIVFGTAGLRGMYGAGSNRMNRFTVGRATQGLANYILNTSVDKNRGVVIAYDCRHHSKEFAELAAEILIGNKIPVYLFPTIHSTPELSFAITELHAISGINMTASHNPKEYNGYKVYWQDGAQISGAISEGIMKEIQKLDMFDRFKREPLSEAKETQMLTILDEIIDLKYLQYIKSMQQKNDNEIDKSISIVYTPLNGAGNIPTAEIAKRRGYKNFYVVKEQEKPDPDFKSVPFPNPEDPKAFCLAEKLAYEKKAEVIIATDPDGDRMAIEVAREDGSYVWLNGNQTGALLIYYLAESKKQSGELHKKSAMVKSIVTGDFGKAICESYNIHVFETLTGFKNICGKFAEIEKEGYQYFFGYEESIGCAPGSKVHDKDGICASMLIMEMAAYYKTKGMSLLDVLNKLYEMYGYYEDDQVSLVYTGEEGQKKIERIMNELREKVTERMGEYVIDKKIDFKDGYGDIPAQNAIKFVFKDNSWFAVRPSGTEPKIKFYFYTKRDNNEEACKVLTDVKESVFEMIEKTT